MLEHHFLAGTRYLWATPNQMPTVHNSGAIVASNIAAGQLRYDGFRAGLHPGLVWAITAGAANLGNPNVNLNHTWLAYAPGQTSYVPVGGNDILTGFMSGCLIIRGQNPGQPMRVYHVGTSDSATDNRLVKLNISQNLPPNATGFDPWGAWTPAQITAAAIQVGLTAGQVPVRTVIALVTTAGHFFSFLLFRMSVNGTYTNPHGLTYYIAGGIRHVPPLNRIQLRGKLLV